MGHLLYLASYWLLELCIPQYSVYFSFQSYWTTPLLTNYCDSFLNYIHNHYFFFSLYILLIASTVVWKKCQCFQTHVLSSLEVPFFPLKMSGKHFHVWKNSGLVFKAFYTGSLFAFPVLTLFSSCQLSLFIIMFVL